MKKKLIRPSSIARHAVLIVVAATALFPFIFMFLSSLKAKAEYYVNLLGFPKNPTFWNYELLFDRYDVGRMLLNSAVVNVIAVLAVMFLSSMMAYVFVKFPTKFGSRVTSLFISSMTIPPIVILIPIFMMMAKLNLVNNYLSLILVYIVLIMPFSLYYTTTVMKSIPDACIESAMIDGAGVFKTYQFIAFPMMRPLLLPLVTVNFLWCWNEFLYALLLLQTNEMRTMTVGVATILGKTTTNMPLMNAGLLLNSLPVILVFAFTQKYFMKGFTAGAVKE